MKIGDLSGGAAQLNDSYDKLRAAWAETETRWNDPASRRFHKERLEPLDPITRKALSAVRRLTEILARAERELSDAH
jgi:hypothetical protein